MKPISEVFHGDCMTFMAGCKDGQFELAVVDPPWGIDAGKKKKYHEGAFTEYAGKSWDENRPDGTYFSELFRVSKYQIIWGGNYFTEFLPPAKNWIVWDKAQPLGISLSMHELAFCNAPGQAPIFRVTNGENGNRCVVKSLAQKYLRIHPTQKPIRLYELCLTHFAKPGDKILDTHLGSQSSRIAAYKLGFDFWGCEIDDDYVREGNARFEKEIAMPLFDPIPQPEQKLLFQ